MTSFKPRFLVGDFAYPDFDLDGVGREERIISGGAGVGSDTSGVGGGDGGAVGAAAIGGEGGDQPTPLEGKAADAKKKKPRRRVSLW